MSDESTNNEALFWDIAGELCGDDDTDEGTMMGTRCVRVGGEFIGMPFAKTGELIVKLPAERVNELVESGAGGVFDFTGKRFKEWVTLASPDERTLRGLLREAQAFARS